jgi:hypothetical protein
MRTTIRPDVHARFMTLVARADAKVRSEEQTLRKRSARLLAHEARERARVAADGEEE